MESAWVGVGEWHYDEIHSSRNLETTDCTAWHSYWKHQYKDFRVLECQSENRFIFIKIKYLVHIIVFGMVISNSDVMSSVIFLYRLNVEVYIKSSNKTLYHDTPVREHSFGCEKILVITSPLTSGHLTPQIVIPLIIIHDTEWKTNYI